MTFLQRPVQLLALAGTLFFTACDKDDDDTAAPPKNITETVVADNDFSLLEAAVIRAGLDNTLATTPNLTVFAPTNAAFTAAGLTEAAINSAPVPTLQAILKYHVLTTTVPSANVPTGPNAAVATLESQNVFATKSSNGVFINGVKVTKADIAASNGIIHAIDRVLMPPSGNIVATAAASPNFSYLVAAVQRADASGTSISNALSAAGPLTVFAPTNQGFIDAGFPTIASIQAADPNTLKSILLYHVVAARVFSSDLTEGAQPTTAEGGTVTIKLAGGAKVKGASNTTDANITMTDIVATNGVIHVIDKVLLP